MCWCEELSHKLKVAMTANVSILEISLTEMPDLFEYIYSVTHDSVATKKLKRSYLHHCKRRLPVDSTLSLNGIQSFGTKSKPPLKSTFSSETSGKFHCTS